MLKEISTAVNFLSQLMRRSRASSEQLQAFREKLTMLLAKKYLAHWDTSAPLKGNAYRAISNLHKPDPLIQQAASESGLHHFTIPKDFVMWIDPGNVSYRFGDRGCIFCVYDSRPAGNGSVILGQNGISTPNMNGMSVGMNGVLTTPGSQNGVHSNMSTPNHTSTTPSGPYSRSASIGSAAHGSPSSTATNPNLNMPNLPSSLSSNSHTHMNGTALPYPHELHEHGIFGTSPGASPQRSRRIEVVHPATHAARKEAAAQAAAQQQAQVNGNGTTRGKEILVG